MSLKEVKNKIEEIKNDIVKQEVAEIDNHINLLSSRMPSRANIDEWNSHRHNVELPEIEESLTEFKTEFDSNFKRERRAEYLNDVCEPIHREIAELEEMKKRHGDFFLFDDKLKKLRKEFKRHYLEYGVVKVDVHVQGYEEQDVERCRQVPIEKLLPGEHMNAGDGRKRMICPFHKENTGSFFIFPDNHYHCFGCQAHGNNAVDLIMQIKSWDFKAALEYLSRF